MTLCLSCGAFSAKTRCPDCQRARRGPYQKRAYRNTPTGPACVCCGSQDDLTRDHVIPIAKGGGDGPLRTLCRPCNSSMKDTGVCGLVH